MRQRPEEAPLHYSCATMLFHWSIAVLIFVEFALALSFSRFNPGDTWYFRAAYRVHMSAGMALLALSVLSVLRRLVHTYPPLPRGLDALTRALAKLVRFLLYVFIIAVPVTGWLILSARNASVAVYGKLSWPNVAYLAHMTYERRFRINDLLLPIHSNLSYIGITLVGLHMAASLYHHFWRGDEVLMRMLRRTRTRITRR
jgi:cytochrome b561